MIRTYTINDTTYFVEKTRKSENGFLVYDCDTMKTHDIQAVTHEGAACIANFRR